MSSILQNNHTGAHGGPNRPQHIDLKPKPPNVDQQNSSAAGLPHNRPPRGRNAWASGVNDYLDGLRALPIARQIPFIPGKELPIGKTLESARTQTRGAFLVATRGKINDPPCDHCASGFGRFSHCISLDDWFHGACATCQMGARGNHCSLRTASDGPPTESKARPIIPQIPHNGLLTESPLSRPSLKRKRKSAKEKSESSKEKKESLKDILRPDGSNSVYNSPYTTMEVGVTPQGPGSPYAGLPSNFDLQSGYAQDESSLLVNYIRKKQDPRNGIKHHLAPAQPGGQPLEPMRPVDGYATRFIKPLHTREASPSLSPSAQLLDQLPPKENREPNEVAVSQSEPQPIGATTLPYIDKLPRKKQRQLFSILGGIQSGIRSVRQQADSMQKQLDLLQAALGIDGEEADGDL